MGHFSVEIPTSPGSVLSGNQHKPTHTAYIVIDPREGSDRKAQWIEVGAVWPHKNGTGFDLVLADQLAVSGRIVCTVRKDRDNGGTEDER